MTQSSLTPYTPPTETPSATASSLHPTHSVLVGYIVWIFGFTGAHRFYYGRPVSGAIWFFTLGLLGVGWLIDIFFIPWMRRTATARYAQGTVDFNICWVLLTFLGPFGAHRFYMGKWITGLIYLCTGGLVGIGWLYDLITLNSQISERNLLDRDRQIQAGMYA